MSECPVVETSLGKVKGKPLPICGDGKQVYNYRGIPFAKPPVGELRFEPPCKAEPWEGILDGTADVAMPWQDKESLKLLEKYYAGPKGFMEFEMSEDCLYLSVYTPNASKTANLPVLFFIYGGGFSIGGLSQYTGNVLSSMNDVVVVIPNYRVNAFGFLSMGKESKCTGNMGLFDQIMALQWTKENVRAFGGNPDNVTIFGESAGAMSVNYHVVSPLSRGLFHRAISHSGSFYLDGLLRETLDHVLERFLSKFDLKKDDPNAFSELKKLPAEKINEVVAELVKKEFAFFGPCIDGKVFPSSNKEDKCYVEAPVPYIIGCNNTEGAGILCFEHPEGFSKGISKQQCLDTLKGYIGGMIYKGLPDSAYDMVIKEYEKGIADDDVLKWSKVYAMVSGDIMFLLPLNRNASVHEASGNKTYMYHMTHQLRFYHDENYGPAEIKKVPFCECDHGDDICFTFGIPVCPNELNIDVKFTEDERKLSIEWMKYITNFAKNGDPNVGRPVEVKWPLYTSEKKEYLSVQLPFSTKAKLLEERTKFWKEVIDPMRSTAKQS